MFALNLLTGVLKANIDSIEKYFDHCLCVWYDTPIHLGSPSVSLRGNIDDDIRDRAEFVIKVFSIMFAYAVDDTDCDKFESELDHAIRIFEINRTIPGGIKSYRMLASMSDEFYYNSNEDLMKGVNLWYAYINGKIDDMRKMSHKINTSDQLSLSL